MKGKPAHDPVIFSRSERIILIRSYHLHSGRFFGFSTCFIGTFLTQSARFPFCACERVRRFMAESVSWTVAFGIFTIGGFFDLKKTIFSAAVPFGILFLFRTFIGVTCFLHCLHRIRRISRSLMAARANGGRFLSVNSAQIHTLPNVFEYGVSHLDFTFLLLPNMTIRGACRRCKQLALLCNLR